LGGHGGKLVKITIHPYGPSAKGNSSPHVDGGMVARQEQ